MKKILLITSVITLVSLTTMSCIFGFQSATGKFTFDSDKIVNENNKPPEITVSLTITIESKDTEKVKITKDGKPVDKVTINVDANGKASSDKIGFSWVGYNQKVEDAEFKVSIESSHVALGKNRTIFITGDRIFKHTIEAGKENDITFRYDTTGNEEDNAKDWNLVTHELS